MSAIELIQYVSEALYVWIFVLTAWRAIERPRLASIEIALLFGAATVVVAESLVFVVLGVPPPQVVSDLAGALLLLLPYILLRLVDEFAGVPPVVLHLAELALAASIIALFAGGQPAPLWVVLLAVAYFVLTTLYVTVAFVLAARESRGSTARRMTAVAAGSCFLALDIFVAGIGAVLPGAAQPLAMLGGLLGLASGLAFYLGFATPDWLQRSWREPEMLAMLERADDLAAQADTPGMIRQLEAIVSMTLGLPHSFAMLWNEAESLLEAVPEQAFSPAQLEAMGASMSPDGDLLRVKPGTMLAGRCFELQQPIYSENPVRDDPAHADLYRQAGVHAILAAPMRAGGERFGVLGVYTQKPRLFAEDSLGRMRLMAHQAAIVVRTRRLLERNAELRGQEEVSRLKDEFLSSATHDLKTPLTAIKGITQWIRRRITPGRDINADDLRVDLGRIEAAAERMTSLVNELLDISRVQMRKPLELTQGNVDLASLARDVCQHHQEMTSRHEVRIDEASQPVTGRWDGPRLERVLDNLIGNAIKYSPEGGEVRVSIRKCTDEASQDWAVLDVRDGGIGIHAEDADRIFDRYERGRNASQLGIAGTGIGLAYVREIVAAHGGRVAVQSEAGKGSTFTVWLPLSGPKEGGSSPEPS